MGMTRTDFMALTPDQFNAVYHQWEKHVTYCQQASWEQARFVALSVVSPYTKKGLKPTDLIRFDWDPDISTGALCATRSDFERIAEKFNEKE